MRLQLTRRTDYAIRACIHLAMEARCPIPSRQIAQEMAIPARFLPQVLGDLARAGIVTAMTGKHGGYCLHDDPAAVTLLHLVEAVEGSRRRDRCVMRDVPCDSDPSCALHPALDTAEASFVDVLRATSVADLAARQRAAQAGSGRERPERTQR